MKLTKFFKKTKNVSSTINVEKLEKKQLEKVIGGASEYKLFSVTGQPTSVGEAEAVKK